MSSTIVLIIVFLIIVVVGVAVIVAVKKGDSNSNKDIVVIPPKPEESKTVKVSIKTTKGEIVGELRKDLMPYTVENFMNLVGRRFYNGLIFHRSELWVIQGGDPTGTGNGGPGYTIKLEVNRKLKNIKGAIAMARLKEPNTAGSQFYILKRDAGALNGKYAVFGNVIKGMDVVNKIEVGDGIIEIAEIKEQR